MLTGQLPWNFKTGLHDLFEDIKETSKNGLNFPEDKHISEELKHLINGCLQFAEKDRFGWI